jgi:hypothetical protein
MAFFLVCVSAPVHSNISFESPFWTTLQPRALFPLLKRAIQTHSRRTREAAVGRGIDRHLLGLKLMLEELPPDTPSSLDSPSTSGSSRLTSTPATPQEIRTHPLFTDPLFARSQEWKLSTSALSAGYHFRGTGFGAVFPDGYGINCEFKLSLSESLCRISVGGRSHRLKEAGLFLIPFTLSLSTEPRSHIFLLGRSHSTRPHQILHRVQVLISTHFHEQVQAVHRGRATGSACNL